MLSLHPTSNVLKACSSQRIASPSYALPIPRSMAACRHFNSSTATKKEMRAVLVKGHVGPASNLFIGHRPIPILNEHPLDDGAGAEVLCRVKAFGLNRMDILQREGKYPLPPGTTDILGVEFSGVVEDVGPGPEIQGSSSGDDTYRPRVGDEVFGLALGGAYAEYIKVRSSLLLAKPQALSWEQAAAIPENFYTAYQALRTIADLRPPNEWDDRTKQERRQSLGLGSEASSQDDPATIGKDVLIHAGASGVGLAAIQLARDLGARRVFATAGSDEKVNVCVKTAGADAAFNYKTSDWAMGLAAYNGLDGKKAKTGSVDVVVDFVGGDYWNKNLASLRRDGRVVYLATMGGPYVKTPKGADILSLVYKRLRVEGSTLRSRSLAYQGNLVQDFLRQGILDRILTGLDANPPGKGVTPHHIFLHKVASWKDIQTLHLEMEANKNIGKMIATID